MSETETLKQCEAEANSARKQLERDLQVLRSPSTLANFKQTITDETLRVKDTVVDSLTESAKSSVTNLVEDLKGRATANPGAALAIAAGLGLHLARRPPITAALLGLGIYSLFRTRPATYSGVAQAGENLKKQVSEVAMSAQEAAVDLKDVVVSKVKDAADSGLEAAASVAADIATKAEAAQTIARQSFHDAQDKVTTVTSQAATSAGESIHATADLARENRDTLLLGLAGLAVTAAIGISVQRRLAEP